eukprot:2446171-Prymnesium_polylepis.1
MGHRAFLPASINEFTNLRIYLPHTSQPGHRSARLPDSRLPSQHPTAARSAQTPARPRIAGDPHADDAPTLEPASRHTRGR